MDYIQVLTFGLISGLVGTTAMTAGQYIEIAITRRRPSLTPALIISKVFRFNLDTFEEKSKWRLNNFVHWSYGLVWGVLLGWLYSILLPGLVVAILLYFLIFWIQGLIVVPAYKIAPPIWKWEAKWIYLDGFFHFVYAIVTASIFAMLIA